eukprot:7388999-Prymnesium_polylepis.1
MAGSSRRRLATQRVERFDALPRSAAWHAVHDLLQQRRRGRRACAACPDGPPYGRMAGCPTDLRVLPMGIVADRGYASAAGGQAAALREIGAALHSLNGLFQDQ